MINISRAKCAPLVLSIAATFSILLPACSHCPSSSTSCGDVCLAAGSLCGGCSSDCGSNQLCVDGQCLGTQVATLSYQVVDAQYSVALDRIVITDTDNVVHVYDPRTHADVAIPFAALITPEPPGTANRPLLGLAPDGLRAAVVTGIYGALWLVYLDLAAGTVLGQWKAPPDFTYGGVALGDDGYAYTFNSFSVNLSTGVFQPISPIGDTSLIYPIATASPDGTSIYYLDESLIRGDMPGLSRIHPLGGQVSSLDHAIATTCGQPWVSRDGTRIFTGCGATFGSAVETGGVGTIPAGPSLEVFPVDADDVSLYPPIQGLDDPSNGSPVAAVGIDPHASPGSDHPFSTLSLYDPSTLALQSTLTAPLITYGGVSHPSSAQYVFYDSSGTTRFELVWAGQYPNAWGVASF